MDSKYVWKVKFGECFIFQGGVYKGEIALCLGVSHVKPSFYLASNHTIWSVPSWKVYCVGDPIGSQKASYKSDELMIMN